MNFILLGDMLLHLGIVTYDISRLPTVDSFIGLFLMLQTQPSYTQT